MKTRSRCNVRAATPPMGMPVKVDDKDWLRLFMAGGDNIGERLYVCFKAITQLNSR